MTVKELEISGFLLQVTLDEHETVIIIIIIEYGLVIVIIAIK